MIRCRRPDVGTYVERVPTGGRASNKTYRSKRDSGTGWPEEMENGERPVVEYTLWGTGGNASGSTSRIARRISAKPSLFGHADWASVENTVSERRKTLDRCSESACNTHGGFHFCGLGGIGHTFSFRRLGHLLSRSVRRSVFICGTVRARARTRVGDNRTEHVRFYTGTHTVVGYSRVCLFLALLFPRRSKPKHNNTCPEGLTRRERPSAHLYYTRPGHVCRLRNRLLQSNLYTYDFNLVFLSFSRSRRSDKPIARTPLG